MEEAVELRAAAMAELRAAVAGTAEGMEEAVELQAACDERNWVTRGPEDRSTADSYSGLPQQTSADPTPGCMHAHQGAPDQCYP